jgi:hypothetical protein
MLWSSHGQGGGYIDRQRANSGAPDGYSVHVKSRLVDKQKCDYKLVKDQN